MGMDVSFQSSDDELSIYSDGDSPKDEEKKSQNSPLEARRQHDSDSKRDSRFRISRQDLHYQ